MKKTNIPMNLLTKEGFEKIKEKIEYRENTLRKKLSETLNSMRNQGDLSENDGYTLAVEENEQNEEEILRLKNLIMNSKVVKNTDKSKVNIGNKITLLCDGQREKIYTLVGEDHANPLENRISYKSPIGKALINRKVGDKFKLTIPKGEINCEINAIE